MNERLLNRFTQFVLYDLLHDLCRQVP
jgi:hypothetical protein